MNQVVCVEKPAILARAGLRQRDCLIEASAGTGKTFTIEHLVVDLLIEEGANLGQILVVTFTEKATQELRRRILQKIRAILAQVAQASPKAPMPTGPHWRIDDRVQRHLQEATHALEAANISTIHGFCNAVLREFAFENGLPFQLEQVDANHLLADVYPRFLRRHVLGASGARAARVTQYLQQQANGLDMQNRHGLFALLRSLLNKPATLLPDLETARAKTEQLCTQWSNVVEPDWHKVNIRANYRAGLAEDWQTLAQAIRDQGDALDILCELTAAARSGKNTLFSEPAAWSFNKAKPGMINGAEDLAPRLLEWLANLREVVAMGCEPDKVLVIELLPHLAAMLREEKEQRAQIDFNDMIHLVAETLRGSEGVALCHALRSKYRYALIDEFQDTDADQWTIFSNVFLTSDHHRLYLIGDPKQAIYSFRGADIHVYLAARQALLDRGGLLLSLADNYRSSAAILDGINALFAVPHFFGEGIAYQAVGCGKPTLTAKGVAEPAVQLLQLTHRGEHRLKIADVHQAYCDWMAAEIKTLLASLIIHTGEDDERPVRPKDIAILVRKRQEALLVGEALDQAGIAYAFYKQSGLFQSPEALDMLDMLHAIAHPHDESACLRALLTPFFPLGFEELTALPMVPDEYRHWFASWHQMVERYRDVRRLFDDIFDKTRIMERRFLLAGDERAITNYEHLADILQREGAHCNMRQLLRLLRDYVEERRQTGNDALLRLESAREAVQIMTVHASKGLEFPVVFVFGGFTAGRATQFHEFHDPIHGRIIDLGRQHDDAHAREQDLENRRLGYVALTRAALRLYLPYLSDDTYAVKGAYASILQRLQAMTSRHFGRQERDITDFTQVAAVATPAHDTPSPPPLTLPQQRLDYDRLLVRKNRFTTASYTRLTQQHETDTSLFGEGWRRERVQDERDDLAGTAAMVLPKGRETGICLHEILESVTALAVHQFSRDEFLRWERQESVQRLLNERLTPFELEHVQDTVAEIVWHALTQPVIDQIAVGDLAPEDRLHEVDFFYPMVGDRGVKTMLNGSIDLVFRHEGIYYFADWKSDSLETYDATYLHQKVQRDYQLQIEIYTWAMLRWLGISDEADYEQRFGGVLYLFLRGMTRGEGIYRYRPRWQDVQQYHSNLLRRL